MCQISWRFLMLHFLGSIHTCDLLGVNYWLKMGCTVDTFTLVTWATFTWTEKFNNGVVYPFFVIAWTEKIT